MADRILKPDSGNDLVLQNDDGSAKIEINEAGTIVATPSLQVDNIKIDEVWGNEISLEYQNKYAGTCDLTAVAYGKPSIIDWKQSNKPKKEEWVEDYKLQLGAYYLAHTANYGPIEQGVISICTRDLQYQEFRLSEADLKEYGDKFLQRVEQFNKLEQPVS